MNIKPYIVSFCCYNIKNLRTTDKILINGNLIRSICKHRTIPVAYNNDSDNDGGEFPWESIIRHFHIQLLKEIISYNVSKYWCRDYKYKSF